MLSQIRKPNLQNTSTTKQSLCSCAPAASSAVLFQRATNAPTQLDNSIARIRGPDDTRSANDHVCAGVRALVHIIGTYSSIDLDVEMGVQLTNAAHFRHHIRHELLAAKARLHRHYQRVVQLLRKL